MVLVECPDGTFVALPNTDGLSRVRSVLGGLDVVSLDKVDLLVAE